MDKLNKDLEQDNSVDRELQEMFGFSEEALLEEFENAGKDNSPLPIPDPPSDEFDRIWARIQEERSDSDTLTMHSGKVIKPRFRWKRLAAVGLIACLIAGSGCFVAMGTKSYFYREKVLADGQASVIVNDAYKADVNGEEEAYVLIEKKLEIKPLKLGFIPKDMVFSSVMISDGYAVIEFMYKEERFYFIQSKYNTNVSYDFKTDAEVVEDISSYNKWLRIEIPVKVERLNDEKEAYEAKIVSGGAVYRLFGKIEKDVFLKIIKEVTF